MGKTIPTHFVRVENCSPVVQYRHSCRNLDDHLQLKNHEQMHRCAQLEPVNGFFIKRNQN